MNETSDELAFVFLDGGRVTYAYAVLIHVPWGWQVELHDVPAGGCPPPRQVGGLTLETRRGDRCEGKAIADLVVEEGAFVLLSGIGQLRRIAPADAA